MYGMQWRENSMRGEQNAYIFKCKGVYLKWYLENDTFIVKGFKNILTIKQSRKRERELQRQFKEDLKKYFLTHPKEEKETKAARKLKRRKANE